MSENWFTTEEARSQYEQQVDFYNAKRGEGDCRRCLGKALIASLADFNGIYGVNISSCPYCHGTGDGATDRMDSFEAETDWQVRVKEKAKRYLTEEGSPWWYIGGQVGAGKSHICMGILQRLQGDVTVFYWNIESGRMKGIEGDQSLIRKFQNAEILLIDDFMCGDVTQGDINLARQIVDYRYNKGLRTLFSSEKQYVELRSLTEGTASRIVEKTIGGRYCVSLQHDRSRDFRRGGDHATSGN